MWSPAALNLHVMQETSVQSLGGEDPLEKKMSTHSSSLACRIPRTEEPSGLQSMWLQWVNHDWATFTFFQYQEKILSFSSLLLLFSCSVMPNFFPCQGLQQAMLPCPSLLPWVCSNSCPLSQWYHPAILSSIVPFSSCPQFFPVTGSFPMSQLFASGGQSIGASASSSVLPMNIQSLFL